ncbi:MAG: N5-glutamine methyltransferase family protein, partial [Acidobacteriota bacterium]
DLSMAALSVARLNAERLGLRERICLVQGSCLESLAGEGILQAVVSNPPYIPAREMATLPREVLAHEPAAALTCGPEGLEVTRQVIADAARTLAAGGCLAMEIHPHTADRVLALFRRREWGGLSVRRDLAGLNRVVTAIRRERSSRRG